MDSSDSHTPTTGPTWLYSLIGAVILFAILIAVNFIVKRAVPLKADLTEDKLHTLADGTKEILANLDTPVKLTFFASRDKDNVPPGLTAFAAKMDALLDEYARNAKDDLLEIERVDPMPDSEEEDRAKLNDLQALPGRYREPFYIGLTVTCLERKSTIPVVSPGREQMIEYDISRAIVEVTRDSAPKVGVMSPLPIAGTPSLPFGNQRQGPPPWFFYNQMTRDYDPNPGEPGSNFTTLEMDLEEVPEDIEVVLLVHPAGISEQAEFALDQFLLRGGRIVAFLDAFSVYADRTRPQAPPFSNQPPPQGTPVSSDLKTLLPAWGVEFESNQVVADLENQGIDRLSGARSPVVLTITNEGIDEEDTLTRDMRELYMQMAGTFYVEEKEGIDVQVLVETSETSQLVASMSANTAPDRLARTFEASGKNYPLALRLTGMFKTAFPGGKPKAEGEAGDEEGEKEDAEKEEQIWLTESQKESSILLVADSDMLADVFAMATTRSGQVIGYLNHNVPLVEGAVEQAAGGSMLTSIRSRGSSNRPFKKFKELEAAASEKYQEQLEELDKEAQKLGAKIQEALTKRGDNQLVIRGADVQEELIAFREQEAETNKKRRELERELRKDVRKIENGIKTWNIVGVPLLVALIGVVHLLLRRQKMSAR